MIDNLEDLQALLENNDGAKVTLSYNRALRQFEARFKAGEVKITERSGSPERALDTLDSTLWHYNCPYDFGHTRGWCGRNGCRAS